jgi:hypothetical protein
VYNKGRDIRYIVDGLQKSNIEMDDMILSSIGLLYLVRVYIVANGMHWKSGLAGRMAKLAPSVGSS